MEYYKTARLVIRDAAPADADDLFEIMADENVLKYNCMRPITRDETEGKIETGFFGYCIELVSEQKVIGFICASDDELRYKVSSTCISYELNTAYTGKGYMTEALTGFLKYAFYTLNADTVSARVLSPNERSIKLMERLGFVHEGTLRRAVVPYCGVLCDDLLFSMMKEEFAAG